MSPQPLFAAVVSRFVISIYLLPARTEGDLAADAEITDMHPFPNLKKHPRAHVHLDRESAALLEGKQ